jgi:hypothetical protein
MTCPRTIFGRPACRFRPRYDKIPVGAFTAMPEGRVLFNGFDKVEIIYVRDVCTRCGKTIEREGK